NENVKNLERGGSGETWAGAMGVSAEVGVSFGVYLEACQHWLSMTSRSPTTSAVSALAGFDSFQWALSASPRQIHGLFGCGFQGLGSLLARLSPLAGRHWRAVPSVPVCPWPGQPRGAVGTERVRGPKRRNRVRRRAS